MEAVGVELRDTEHTLSLAVFHVLLRVVVECTTWQNATWPQQPVQNAISVVFYELQHSSLVELCIEGVTAFLLEHQISIHF